ncbi:MAG: hypothetical protein NC307_03955 [Roseburia sp.]|nr:hypothetical protein [Roseburia sp.]
MGRYMACICEGGAERAILDLLLDAHKLIFEREDLIEEEVLRCRKGKEFEERYLRKGFAEKITIYRVLDSRSEKFRLSKVYEPKVDIVNVITAPEIEILIICNEGKYKEYEREKRKNPELKPSGYCKSLLHNKNIKSYDFVKKYFADIEVLIHALHEYRRVSKVHGNEKSLWDLLQ